MSRRARSTLCWLALAASALAAGCRPRSTGADADADNPPDAVPTIKRHAVENLRIKIGTYVLPQDQGRLQIACPANWDWADAGAEYVLGFHRKNESLNDLPRIRVAAREAPPGFQDVNEGKLLEFVHAIAKQLGDKQLENPVTPVMIGQRACAAHVEWIKHKTGRAPRLVVQTVGNGRLYAIQLDVAESQFAKYRDAAYAVVASIKVAEPEAKAPPSGPAPEEQPKPEGKPKEEQPPAAPGGGDQPAAAPQP